MADTYVTLNEAAELESIGYDTMKKESTEIRRSFLLQRNRGRLVERK